MDKVQFETNIPIELRLQFPEGKLGESRFGGNQYMFSSDRGPFWVSEAVGNILHDQIRKQNVQVGEPIEICKREVSQGNGRKAIRWEVAKVGFAPGEQPDGTFAVPAIQPGAGASTPAPAVQAVSKQPMSNGNGSTGTNGHANGAANGNSNPHVVITDGRPKTKLEDALKTVVAAVHAATEFAKTIGYAMPQFTSEDLRTMANTLMIERRGGSSNA